MDMSVPEIPVGGRHLSRHQASLLAFVACLLTLAIAASTLPRPPLSRFLAPAAVGHKPLAQPPWSRLEFLPIAGHSAHAATLTELPDGRLAAAWFTGSREGADDVRIVLSVRQDEDEEHRASNWGIPRPIANREQTIRDTHRSVRKLGNPVLFTDGPRLHLFYVSAGLGGWAGSSINHRFSDDQGKHWSTASKLITSPFLNVSTLVRTPPVKLADGTIGLPVYHELGSKFGEWLRLDSQGDILSKVKLPHPEPTLQPALVVHDSLRATAFLRDAGKDKKIQRANTLDGGRHWQHQAPLPLGNSDSSLATLRLGNGRILLAANPETGRHALDLWLSDANATHWQRVAMISQPQPHTTTILSHPPRTVISPPVPCQTPDDPRQCRHETELSYPALLQTQDGLIHLAYTWHRQRIQMLSFNAAWLDATH